MIVVQIKSREESAITFDKCYESITAAYKALMTYMWKRWDTEHYLGDGETEDLMKLMSDKRVKELCREISMNLINVPLNWLLIEVDNSTAKKVDEFIDWKHRSRPCYGASIPEPWQRGGFEWQLIPYRVSDAFISR